MEIGEEIPKEKKRKLNSDEDDNKKPRLFSAKEFRKQLKTTDKQTGKNTLIKYPNSNNSLFFST